MTDTILRNAFYEETDEILEEIERCLLDIEAQGNSGDRIDNLFRYMHTLKGSSAAMEIDDMARLTHHLEDILGMIRDGKLEFSAEIIGKMFEGLDELKTRVFKHKNDEEYEIDIDKFSINPDSVMAGNTRTISGRPERIKNDFLTEEDKGNIIKLTGVEENAYSVSFELDKDTPLKGARLYIITDRLKGTGRIYKTSWDNIAMEEIEGCQFSLVLISNLNAKEIEDLIYSVSEVRQVCAEQLDLTLSTENTNATRTDSLKSSIRVSTDKLDKLLRLVEELSVDKERLKQLMKTVEQKYKQDDDIKVLESLVEKIDFIGNEMQESVMSTRMYTLENVFRRFPRVIRDLALKEGKEVELIVEGETTELDRSIIEKIVDPLNHIIRNSIDHGLETPDERIKAGKKPTGTIKLSAGQEQGYIYIRVQDDGRGMNLEKVKRKAISKGIINKSQAAALTEKEILDLIFMPGFSTSETITDVSGRGVGMNVVKENIEKINGSIEVDNNEGKGLSITLKLPLTLAIIQSLLIKSGKYRFALPLLSITEIFKIKKEEYDSVVKLIQGKEVINRRDQVLSIIRISNLFDKNKKNKSKAFIGIVISFSTSSVVLAVEEIIGQQQIVIKSMEKYTGRENVLGELKGISGTAILGDGDFAYVLDVQTLIKEMVIKNRQRAFE